MRDVSAQVVHQTRQLRSGLRIREAGKKQLAAGSRAGYSSHGAISKLSRHFSAQLAVLAAAAIVEAALLGFLIGSLLANDAQAYPRYGSLTRHRNGRVAFLATRQARSLMQVSARALNAILYRGIDLLLHRTVVGPTGRHVICSVYRLAS
jgi:hypothetical protein